MTYRVQSSYSSVRGQSKKLVVQSHKAGCLSWSSVSAGIPKVQIPMSVKKWMCQQGKCTKVMSKIFLLPCPYTDVQKTVWLQLKALVLLPQRSRLEVNSHTSTPASTCLLRLVQQMSEFIRVRAAYGNVEHSKVASSLISPPQQGNRASA